MRAEGTGGTPFKSVKSRSTDISDITQSTACKNKGKRELLTQTRN